MKLDKADIKFSKFIRTRDKWTCKRCGVTYPEKSQGLHCSHYWNRIHENTRFEPDNCVALCFGCHRLWDGDEREFYAKFKKEQLGEERFKSLEVQKNTYKKKDRKMSLMIAKKMLEDETN